MDTSILPTSIVRALSIADDNAAASVGFLGDLVRTPSLTGEEGKAQERVASWCDDFGARARRLDIDLAQLFRAFPDTAQYPTHWKHDLILGYETRPTYQALAASGLENVLNYRDRPNVVATWLGRGGGRSIILNGHIDTVTVEPGRDWHCDPFGAAIEDGCMYGRGTSDMKGGLVAGIMAMKYLREAGVELRGDVILQSVVNEEHSGNGTLDLVRRGITADAAIVLEPTDNRVFLSHPGGLYWQVTVPGIQRSPGSRWDGGRQAGVSAIEKLPPVINAMLEVERRANAGLSAGDDGSSASMSLVFGKAAGGYYETVTAGEAVLRGSVYFPPGAGTVDDMIRTLRECVHGANRDDPFLATHGASIEFLHHDDPTHQQGPVAVASHIHSLMQGGDEHRHEGANEGTFACDMRHLVNRGNIPTVVFGPGTIAQAHKPNEHIRISDYLDSIKYLIACIGTWCNLDREQAA